MHFGKWILVSFVFFALFIGTLITLCLREDISLVSKDYYEEELAYQKKIEQKKNVLALPQKPVVTYTNQTGLKIELPENTSIDAGELKLFCPSNAQLDKHFKLQSSPVQTFKITTKKGMYRVQLFWTTGGKDYYFEDQIII
ncbi:MAG: FixH family protein [Bacteroidetes bacterium]|nr:FixH family protein [Bacteroidota bacterium]